MRRYLLGALCLLFMAYTVVALVTFGTALALLAGVSDRWALTVGFALTGFWILALSAATAAFMRRTPAPRAKKNND